ncbi:hypothetical protein GOP47_0030348 [Adiantum capillus-veneris]|nr:hypothetical protein GOP47_0030348 [Adiantum capillus-veneris]
MTRHKAQSPLSLSLSLSLPIIIPSLLNERRALPRRCFCTLTVSVSHSLAQSEMSAAIVRDFFPGVESFLGDTLWTFLFPAPVEQLCPRPHLVLHVPSWCSLANEERTFTLMWPAASICCLLGAILGFLYGLTLLCKALASKARNGTFIWGCAFLWYGLMSLSGLFYHCISAIRVFYLLDLISTACACVSLLAVYRRSDDRSRSSLLFTYGLLAFLALVGGNTIRNMLYLGPASLAFILGAYFAAKASKGGFGQLALAFASTSAVMAVAAIPLDSWLCFIFGSNFSMLFWFFLGCDLAIVCLFHLTLAESEANATIHPPSKCKLR